MAFPPPMQATKEIFQIFRTRGLFTSATSGHDPPVLAASGICASPYLRYETAWHRAPSNEGYMMLILSLRAFNSRPGLLQRVPWNHSPDYAWTGAADAHQLLAKLRPEGPRDTWLNPSFDAGAGDTTAHTRNL